MFITFEGGEGVGKTTQIRLLQLYLTRQKYTVFCTREPGGGVNDTKLEQLRNLIVQYAWSCNMAELLLLMANRAEHYFQYILPNLQQGHIVICDRYIDSTYVYQGILQHMGCSVIDSLHQMIFHTIPYPDCTILLDAHVSQLSSRRSNKNKFDNLHESDHEIIRKGFLTIAKRYPSRIRMVDTQGCVEDTHSHIVNLINHNLSYETY